MLVYLILVVLILVSAALAFGLASLLHLQGATYLVFVSLILLIGIAAAIVILVLHNRAKKQRKLEAEQSGGESNTDLDLLLNDARRKLRTSQRGAKNFESLPLLYVLGESGSAKTTTVIKSGLDPELVAGTAAHEGDQVQTRVLNLWFTSQAVLVEVGSIVRQSNVLLSRLVSRTRARAYRSAFGRGAAPRGAIVCLDAEQLLAADAGASSLTSARATGAQLREISRLLGMPLPVYVIVTKLDRVPHFEEFVRNLSEAEVLQVLGAALPLSEGSPGMYADQASRSLSAELDALCYKLGEFRLETLNRETEQRNIAPVYEFPREFGKLRKNLNSYLVELCKPSHLSVNPYLRGFYLTGVRARVVERAANTPPAPEPRTLQDAGATQFLNISALQAQHARAAASSVMVATRVPQWTFLPRLLPEVILGDKHALSSNRQTTPARIFRRFLFGTLALVFATYCILLLISYRKNSALEHRIATATQALPVAGAASNALPTLNDLRALDDLREVIVQLDGYQQNGTPWSYRFGLYQGARLEVRAREIYFDRFRSMFLNPAQQAFVNYLRALPDAPQATSDFAAYTQAYDPLKAYLITTGYPAKSQPKFLTPVFFQYWARNQEMDSDLPQLAKKQIDFYGEESQRQPPYSIEQDSAVVEHAQGYLSNFLAETRIYQAMLTDADKTGTAIDFNRQYPGSSTFVVAPHVVRGAFTRTGFTFMQDAIQHPDRYAQGETWVLGNRAGKSLNSALFSKDLGAQYSSDYLKEWHSFLLSAHVVGCGTLKEAPTRLNTLAGPASPLLQLLFTVSHNTAVSDPLIKSTFQPTQALVDPNATDRFIGGPNQPYVTALSQLAGAIDLASQSPTMGTDPAAAFANVSPQIVAANGAAQQAAQAFSVDSQWHSESTVLNLLKAPIECVTKLAPSPGAAANGGGQKICGAINPLLGKIPFAPYGTVQARMPEVDAVFAPESGVISSMLATTLKPYFIQQGSQYAPSPSGPQPLNPRFAQFISRATHVTSGLYPPGQKTASLSFTLRFMPGSGVSSATWVVDGQRIPQGSTLHEFKWNAAAAQQASLEVDSSEVAPYQGTFALFQLVHTGTSISRTPGGYRIDFPIDVTFAGRKASGSAGTPKKASFELSGPGAEVLMPEFFSGLGCALPVVK